MYPSAPTPRTTARSHSTSASAAYASLSALCTASPTSPHSVRFRAKRAGMETTTPAATPAEADMCPRCTIAARAASANDVASAGALAANAGETMFEVDDDDDASSATPNEPAFVAAPGSPNAKYITTPCGVERRQLKLKGAEGGY